MKVDFKYNPEPDYPYFHYNPEGDGFVYFKSESERDEATKDAIQGYLDDGWDESVVNIVAGKVTSQASMVDVELKPDEMDDNGEPLDGTYWDADWDYKCNYELKPLGFVCPSTKAIKDGE
jgi:hypothetical protein